MLAVLGRWGFEKRDHSRPVDAKRERMGGGGTHLVSLNGALGCSRFRGWWSAWVLGFLEAGPEESGQTRWG